MDTRKRRFHENCWLGGAKGWMKEGDHSDNHHYAYCVSPKKMKVELVNGIKFCETSSKRSDRKSVKGSLLMGRCKHDGVMWDGSKSSTLEVSKISFHKNIGSMDHLNESKWMIYNIRVPKQTQSKKKITNSCCQCHFLSRKDRTSTFKRENFIYS